jgi:uncharacterized protein (TIGR02300 family)
MKTEALGVRRVCQSCQARFYDLKRKPITCPKCEAVFDPGVLYKTKRTRSSGKEAAPTVTFDPLEEIELGDDTVEAEVLIEDPDDLGHEEDVVGGLDHHEEKDNT